MKQFVVVIEKGADREAFKSYMEQQGILYEEVPGLQRHFFVDDGFAHEDILHVDDGKAVSKALGVLTPDFDTDSWGRYRTIRRDLPWYLPRFVNNKTLAYSPVRTGVGVDLYVIDGRIRTTHEQFNGQITVIYDAVSGEVLSHGTEVAALAVGLTLGVSTGCLVWNAIIFNAAGSANNADIITAFGECLSHYTGRAGTNRPAVITTSVDSSASTVGDAAVDCIEAGMVVVGAAGNNMLDLSSTGVFPAEAAGVVCVGGANPNDGPYFSGGNGTNYGTRVDILAPSQSLYTATSVDDTSYKTGHGTSYGSPHVAGVLCLMLEGHTRLADEVEVAAVVTKLLANATTGKYTQGPHPGTAALPDKILYVDPALSFEPF